MFKILTKCIEFPATTKKVKPNKGRVEDARGKKNTSENSIQFKLKDLGTN